MTKKLNDYMTSELLFQAMKIRGEDSERNTFISEYERRLKMMGLKDEQIARFRRYDETAIKNGCCIEPNILLATKSLIEKGIKETIKVENCTFSELVYLTEDSDFIYVHHKNCLSEEACNLIRQHALYFGMCKSAVELRDRMRYLGITEDQESIFIKNELKIIKKMARHHFMIKEAW